MEKLRNRHIAIMELMIMCPSMNQNELAEKLGYTPSRLSIIVNDPLFQLAFNEFRRRHQLVLSELITEATADAIRASREIINDKEIPIPFRQGSIRDILEQGHAKAPEKRASITATMTVPPGAIEALGQLAKEISQPFTPSRFFKKEEELDAGEA